MLLDKHILRQDMNAAIGRMQITSNDAELSELTREQIIMYRDVSGAQPGNQLWLYLEKFMTDK